MATLTIKPVYTLNRQPEDGRDYKAANLIDPYKDMVLPDSFSLRKYEPPIFTQEIGDCTANVAIAAYYMLVNTPAIKAK